VVSASNYLGYFEKDKNAADIKDAKSYIDKATAHEDTKTKAKTWVYRGRIYMLIAQSKDTSVTKLSANAIDEATNAYAEAVKLDTKGNYPEAKNALKNCMMFLSNSGIEKFQAGNFSEALSSFEKVITFTEQSENKIDSNAVFNAAMAAERAGNDEKSLQYYQRLIDIKYGLKGPGDVPEYFNRMAQIFKKKGEIPKFLETLQKGKALFPNEKGLILTELNYYIETGKIPEAIANIKLAIEKDPLNPVLHYNQGVLYDNLLNPEKGKPQPDEKLSAEYFINAEKSYGKALELDGNYFDAMYNLGALYFNKGVKQNDLANSITDNKKYDIESKKADELFRKSLPYMEKAEAMNPDDLNSRRALYNSLSLLYRMTDQPELAKKYSDKARSAQ
jgi:tetratricopeptide (TPR) repeat protein